MSHAPVDTGSRPDQASDSPRRSALVRPLLAPLLPLVIAACGAADPPLAASAGGHAPARLCPSTAPLASATPGTTATASTAVTTTPTAVASAPPAPEPYKLLWYDVWGGGQVLLRRHPSGVALIPAFLGAEIEGSTMAVIDPSGLAKWERRFDGVGAADAEVAPDGSIASLAVDTLHWPKTSEPYETRRITVVAPDGKKARSFRLPPTATAESLQIDAAGALLLSGQVTGKATFGKGVEVTSPDANPQGFLASFDADGHAAWARGLPGTIRVRPVSPGKMLVLETMDTPDVRWQKLLFGDGKGKDDWTITVARTCKVESIFAISGSVAVVATPGCFDPSPPPSSAEQQCSLFRLDPATGKVTSTVALPGCAVWADAQGMAVVSEGPMLTLLDAAGKALWTTTLIVPQGCLYQGYETTGVVLDATSIYVAGRCLGTRIGTMFNSPYSRAYDRAETYLGRYDRR